WSMKCDRLNLDVGFVERTNNSKQTFGTILSWHGNRCTITSWLFGRELAGDLDCGINLRTRRYLKLHDIATEFGLELIASSLGNDFSAINNSNFVCKLIGLF